MNSNFFEIYCILIFLSRCLHQFLIHTEKSLIKKCVRIFCYAIFSQKTVNNSYFVFSSLRALFYNKEKNEDIFELIRPFESFKNKLKQTLCDISIVLFLMCIQIWSSSSVFRMSYYVICYIILNRFDEYLYLFHIQIQIR